MVHKSGYNKPKAKAKTYLTKPLMGGARAQTPYKPESGNPVSTTKDKIRGKPLYNVESGGKKYPTANPDFKPNPNPDREINFKGGGANDRVEVKAGGQTFDLSKEEYLGEFVTGKTIALDEALAKAKESTSPFSQDA